MSIGDSVTWMAVNGPQIGYIESFKENGILIRLKGERCVIAHKDSLHPIQK